jgi:hypothetical protein
VALEPLPHRLPLARGARVDLALERGAPSRYCSKDFAFNEELVGATPLWLAARYGEPEIMKTLAEAGASPRHTLPNGTSMLLGAVAITRGYRSSCSSPSTGRAST